MRRELVGATVVVIAPALDPSVLRQQWLIKEELVREDEFGPQSISVPPMALVDAPTYQLLAVPGRLQYMPKDVHSDAQHDLERTVGGIARLLRHLEYSAIGLNFEWHCVPESTPLAAVARAMFWRGGTGLYDRLDSDNARCGGYVSTDVFGVRLNLDIKPVTVSLPGSTEERLQLAFNYNRDVSPEEDGAAAVAEVLALWSQAREHSSSVADLVEEGSS